MVHGRMLLALRGALQPVATLAQAASEPPMRGAGPPRGAAGPAARDGWFGRHADSPTPDQRCQAEARFERGAQSHRPTPEQMRQRWQSSMPGLRRGPHHGRTHGGRPRPG